MSKLRLFGIVGAAFVSGIAFVLACGEDPPMTDADAADCPLCESALRADQLYYRRGVANTVVEQVMKAEATCDLGDLLVSGGCRLIGANSSWAGTSPELYPPADYVDNGFYLLFSGPNRPIEVGGGEADFGVPTAEAWGCVWRNQGNDTGWIGIVDATCLDVTP